LVTLEVSALDADGRLCLDASFHVNFSVIGNAELIQNMGTPWASRRVQLANGTARITARVAGKAIAHVRAEAAMDTPEAWCDLHAAAHPTPLQTADL
jgi:hypothetical protein